jgi:phosphonate transport system substrate-binding protein
MRLILAFSFMFSGVTAFGQNTSVRFFLTPSVSPKVIESRGEYLRQYLQKETGLLIAFKLLKDYEEMVVHFGENIPCFAIMNSQSYIVANQKHGAQAKQRLVRYGASVYYGMIVTKANSPIKSIKDLNGKSIAYTDELSTSGYLFPKKILEKKGVKPSRVEFVNRHDEVIRLVYEGKMDAGAAFYSPPSAKGEIHDARARVKDKMPDVEKVVSILEITEPIPNDPIVFSKDFDNKIAKKITDALSKLAADEFGLKVLQELYGADGVVASKDSDYNLLRKIMLVK